jgi:glycosyltransferase involved in cell wall biosynthesis
VRLIIVSHDLSENALGRAHVIWTLARAAGYQAVVRGIARGPVWAPLRSSEMAVDIRISPDLRRLRDELRTLAAPGSLLVPVKTWPGSLGICLDVARTAGIPVLADIDDPDHAALVGPQAPFWYRSAFRFRMRVRGESPRRFDRLQLEVRSLPRMVSNPAVKAAYGGGYLVPHARRCGREPNEFGGARDLRIAFVGTPRAHKGLDVLRAVVADLEGQGAELTVTAQPPRDAQAWERWVGVTDLATGRAIVAGSDVVVVPLGTRGYATAQLPAKLIDAMALGRPIVATDTPPVRWALADAGLLVPAGDRSALTDGLQELFNVDLRRNLGIRAWERAREMFSIEAVLPTFVDAVTSAALR